MIGARDMIAIKLISNKAAIKLLSGIRAGVTDIDELAKATGVTFAYARLMVGKLIVNGFVEALRPTDLTGARVTVVERMASLANAIECIDANGEPLDPTPPNRPGYGGLSANVLSCIPCCRSISAMARMAGVGRPIAWAAIQEAKELGLIVAPEGQSITEAIAAGTLEFSADGIRAMTAEVME